MCQVFISYPIDNAAGQALAEELEQHLKQLQITVYRDANKIDHGDRWLSSLKQGIENSKAMLWVISSASHDREWQEKEYNEAKQHGLTIIPVLAEDIPIPMQLNDVQAAKLFGEQKAEQRQKLTKSLETLLGIDRIKPLIKAALAAKNNSAYDEALKKWQEVLRIDPDHQRAHNVINELQQLLQQQHDNKQLLLQLVKRMQEIAPIFNDISPLLAQGQQSVQHQSIIEDCKRFLTNELNAEQFIALCQAQLAQPAVQQGAVSPTDYPRFTQRLLNGDIVLFIGSDLPQEYQLPAFVEEQLAQQLANKAKLQGFSGSFSSIAEYYRLNKDLGENSLLQELQQSLNQHRVKIKLYQQLAQIKEPLILVSTTYDNELEKAFAASGKPYVELTSLVRKCEGHGVGHLVVRYSDRDLPEVHHPIEDQASRPIEEEISRLNCFEEGYSIIFNIRGARTEQEHEYQRETLTLAESDYFTFARYAERMIPAYLAKHFKRRGFAFLGFSPKSWEERLIVNALLARRNKAYATEPPFAAGVVHDPLEATWWASQQVVNQPMDMQKLDEHLEEALL